jgi:hypothetical protein
MSPKDKASLSLSAHFDLLCKEHHIRRKNAYLASLFSRYDADELTDADPETKGVGSGSSPLRSSPQPQLASLSGSAMNPQANMHSSASDAELIPSRSTSVAGDIIPTQPPVSATVPKFRIRHLELSGTYLGNHTLVVLFHMMKQNSHLAFIESLSIRGAKLYASDERPTAIKGNTVIQVLAQTLYSHPRLKILDLSDNELATEAYVWLAEFCKSAVSLETIVLERTLLQDHERLHLESLLARNVKFHRGGAQGDKQQRSAYFSPGLATGNTFSSLSVLGGGGGAGVGGSPQPFGYSTGGDSFAGALSALESTASLYPAATSTGTLPSNRKAVHTKSYLERHHDLAPAALLQAGINQSHRLDTTAASVFVVPGVKNVTAVMSSLLEQPNIRVYAKTADERKYLRDLIRRSPFVQFLLPPSELSPGLQLLTEEESKFRSLSFEEREVVQKKQLEEERKRERVDDLIEFIISVLLKAVYLHNDLIVEAGDRAEWIFFVGTGGTVASADGSQHFSEGAYFGEEELLQDDVSGNWRRKMSYLAEVPNSNAPGGSSPFPDDSPTPPARTAAPSPNIGFVSGSPTAASNAQYPTSTPRLVVWQLRREIFCRLFAREISLQRAAWRRFADGVPAIMSMQNYHKSRLCDLLRRVRHQDGEVIEFYRKANRSLSDFLFVVVEGSLLLRNATGTTSRAHEPRPFLRGEVVGFSPTMDLGSVLLKMTTPNANDNNSVTGSIISAATTSTATGQPCLCILDLQQVNEVAPKEVLAHLRRFQKVWW